MTFRQQSDNLEPRNHYLEPETEKPPNGEKTRPAHTRNAQARNIREILALQNKVGRRNQQSAVESYRRIDLGPGGYAIALSTDTRGGMQLALTPTSRR